MTKLTLLLPVFVLLLSSSGVVAQTSQSSTQSAKDEYWGTATTGDEAASVDAVARRADGLDTRFNAYEDNRRRTFDKKRIARSKRMKEILKKEEKMMKKYRRDKRRLRRNKL